MVKYFDKKFMVKLIFLCESGEGFVKLLVLLGVEMIGIKLW